MFDSLFKTVKSVVDVADATIDVATKPVRDGLDFVTEGLKEISQED